MAPAGRLSHDGMGLWISRFQVPHEDLPSRAGRAAFKVEIFGFMDKWAFITGLWGKVYRIVWDS